MFDEKTTKQLGYYVYMLIDPKDNTPFYVGKGTNNRVFDHVKFAIDNPHIVSDKCDKIREIGAENVKHVILTHGLASEIDAYKVEALAIDLLNFSGLSLTNEVSGHHVSESGIMTTDEIERLYNAERLEQIGDDCIVININGQYNRAMGTTAIYNATKQAWRIDKNRRKEIQYVLSEYRGLIIEVFKVSKWYDIARPYGPQSKKAGQEYLASGFDGEVAEDSIRDKYINRSIADRKKKGRANPISYADSINSNQNL